MRIDYKMGYRLYYAVKYNKLVVEFYINKNFIHFLLQA